MSKHLLIHPAKLNILKFHVTNTFCLKMLIITLINTPVAIIAQN